MTCIQVDITQYAFFVSLNELFFILIKVIKKRESHLDETKIHLCMTPRYDI